MKQFKVADIFMDHMVLQRNKIITVWGQGESQKNVHVEISGIAGVDVDVQLDGSWKAELPPIESGSNLVLSISCEEQTISFTDIIMGDVYLAGGQSNMEFFLKYDKDYDTVKEYAKISDIRMYNVPQVCFEGHTTHNKGGYGYWFKDGEIGTECFSAPAYSFARTVYEKTGVPIGLVGCNWGGSTAAAWVSENVLKNPSLQIYLDEYEKALSEYSEEEIRQMSLEAWAHDDDIENQKAFEPVLYGISREEQLELMEKWKNNPVVPLGPYHINRPSGLFHTMLEKIIPFSLGGVLWYQGETDCGDKAKLYDILLSGLISNWRELWNDNFPFLIVQLAPYGRWLDCGNEEYVVVREKQRQVSKTVDSVYIASIMDLGSYHDIHPKEKMEVGRRLGLLALDHIYHMGINGNAPEISSIKIVSDNELELSFTNASELTITKDENDFVLRGNGETLKPQKVSAEQNRVMLIFDSTTKMRENSYSLALGWDDYAVINIHNELGLNVMPFIQEI